MSIFVIKQPEIGYDRYTQCLCVEGALYKTLHKAQEFVKWFCEESEKIPYRKQDLVKVDRSILMQRLLSGKEDVESMTLISVKNRKVNLKGRMDQVYVDSVNDIDVKSMNFPVHDEKTALTNLFQDGDIYTNGTVECFFYRNRNDAITDFLNGERIGGGTVNEPQCYIADRDITAAELVSQLSDGEYYILFDCGSKSFVMNNTQLKRD